MPAPGPPRTSRPRTDRDDIAIAALEVTDRASPPERQKTPEQGAATSVLLATSPELTGIGGPHFSECNEAPVVDHRDADGSGVASYALDAANADRLWNVSEALLQHA